MKLRPTSGDEVRSLTWKRGVVSLVNRPTFHKILKKGAVEGFEPEPYLASVLNCMLWVFYGLPLVHPDSILVVTINSIGLFLEMIYVIIYFIYAPVKERTKVVVVFFLELLLLGVVVVVTLLCFHDTIKRSLLVGSIAVVFTALMYSSPLLMMGKVIKTKSVEYMPFLLSLTSFLNGSVWVIYALLRFDPYILVGNVLGALAGLVQLIIYAIYYKSTPKNKDNRRNESGSTFHKKLKKGAVEGFEPEPYLASVLNCMLSTFHKILKKGAVEGFEPEPYLASVLNCMLWVFYGLPLVHPRSILVVAINGFDESSGGVLP
ncbi:hypothetical protein NE237_007128 [Protea cynaroides]|uniref:Bidirectional sugar transporter SWEET n=1 Tax=Protea cynaroides TaxID=273540 RepID=A0A9Q0KNX4_9MAGN|nr:hypothetical protein NE237_007128 [Protea cynaroides]